MNKSYQVNEQNETKSYMIKGFRCVCACNVFHKPDKTDNDRYKCNACGAEYRAER